MVVIILGNMR